MPDTAVSRRALLACAIVVSCTAAALAARPLAAQVVAGGAAIDRASREALPCLDVALEDADGRAVARGRTDARGFFQLVAPALADSTLGTLRLRFSIDGYAPTHAPVAPLPADGVTIPAYAIAFESWLRAGATMQPPPDGAADAEPWPQPRAGAGPHFPEVLKREGVEGGAVVRFVVDSTGRVDPHSLRTVSATRREFADAARQYLRTDARYRPARRDGRPVCALQQPPFLFRLGT